MQDINSVIEIGNLTRDMELKYTRNGAPVGEFSIAVNMREKKNGEWSEEASFFDCTLFGRIAEAIAQYMVKGTKVSVQGKLKQDRWEKDGQKRSKIKIIADNVQLLSSKSSPGQTSEDFQGPSSTNRPFSENKPSQAAFAGANNFDGGGEDEDIPF